MNTVRIDSKEGWVATRSRRPDRDQKIQWLAPDATIVDGTFVGVWLMNSGMYVYYTPEFWRPRQ